MRLTRKYISLIAILFITFVVLLGTNDAFALTFVKAQHQQLEQEVRAQFGLPAVAKALSDINHFYDWPVEMSPELKLYAGVVWFNQGHVTEATAVIMAAKTDERFRDLVSYYQAMICLAADKADSAKALIDSLENKYSHDADFLLLKSVYVAQTDDLLGAIKIMDGVIGKNRRYGEAYLQRGFLNMMALSHDRAIADFDKAVKYLPDSEIHKKQQALLQSGLIYIRYKFNEKRGMELINQGVALDPSSELVKQMRDAMRFNS